MMKLKKYSLKTDQGPYLQINEDDLDIDLANNLFMIFDGFGGSGIGNECVSMAKETVKNCYVKIGDDPDATFPFFYSYKYLLEGNALINSMHHAHSVVKKWNADKEISERGGASGIGVSLAENILTFASVGNCVSYLYRKGSLEPIIFPDSLESLTQDKYRKQFTTAPMSGLGLFDDLHLQTRELRVLEDDLILMMTDGAYSRITNDELKHIIEKPDQSLNDKIQEIFKASNSRGNMDNQSAIFLQF